MASEPPARLDIWQGNKVLLRANTAEDIDNYFCDGRDADTARLCDEIKLPNSKAALKTRMEKPQDPNKHDQWLGIEALDTGQLVGSMNSHNCDQRHRTFYYGIAIFREHRGKGYASDAVSLLLRFFFRELGYHRVTAEVYAFNQPSLDFHRKLGFVQEGRFRESLFTNGQFHDEITFGMLASEFAPLEAGLPGLMLPDF